MEKYPRIIRYRSIKKYVTDKYFFPAREGLWTQLDTGYKRVYVHSSFTLTQFTNAIQNHILWGTPDISKKSYKIPEHFRKKRKKEEKKKKNKYGWEHEIPKVYKKKKHRAYGKKNGRRLG